ncbi:helix-turn-helix transcriptional regulator [Alloalcanivorax mobilis]|uniref:helix-turn-helix transcriptional regulator n=1 Tax=Alloalcanivorax mobilis TaxID=2019569 RepID=UPI000B5B24D0|nr:helix-turn-helix transcriptional regulator [Alloalcanivorax mobilis]ASK33371.1 helix-turn-helix transcriptional regulator [Alcanivorax sp. N3-2A]|tara:strand:+ start:9658 stop:10440 length:783 start_codon:yes stop_codon:yes gene_type:complete
MTIDDATLASIHCLWDEMADLPASEPEISLGKLFSRIGNLIESRHGYWLSSLRLIDDAAADPLYGWRARSIVFHGELPADQHAYTSTVKQLDKGIPDESTYNHVRRAGRFRATLMVDHVSKEFYSGDHYIHHYLGRGIIDRLFVVMPVNEDVESYFIFDRLRGEPNFTPKELEIASYALRSLGWFNRQIHLSYGQLVADSPLTPTERNVLKHLLSGSAEKIIAEAMSQSPHTTHQYVKTLFRKFNVRSRAELTALWLGHA